MVVVGGGGGGGGAREGMHFSQSKNARLLNFYHLRPAAFFTSTLSRENIHSEALGTSPE